MAVFDVAIIGAGPAGSYAAGLLAQRGLEVGLFERHMLTDVDPVCTGIVGQAYLGLVDAARSVIMCEANSAVLVSPAGHRLHVRSAVPQAWILDRTALELELIRRAGACGVRVRMGSPVETVSREAGGVTLTVRRGAQSERHSSRAVVVASGVNPAITGALGLGNTGSYLVGAHAHARMDGLPETEVYFMPHVERGAFGWLVPLGDGQARIGALGPRNATEVLSRLLDNPGVKRRLGAPVEGIARRPIPVSPLKRGYGDRVVAIGDALGAVKPTTGGGLYFGTLSALSAAAALSTGFEQGDLSARTLAAHDARWQSQLNTELRRGRVLRRVYTRMGPRTVDRFIAAAARTGIPGRLLSDADFSFDRHTAVLVRGLVAALGASLVPAPLLRGSSRE